MGQVRPSNGLGRSSSSNSTCSAEEVQEKPSYRRRHNIRLQFTDNKFVHSVHWIFICIFAYYTSTLANHSTLANLIQYTEEGRITLCVQKCYRILGSTTYARKCIARRPEVRQRTAGWGRSLVPNWQANRESLANFWLPCSERVTASAAAG